MNLKRAILSSLTAAMLYVGIAKGQDVTDLKLAVSYFNELDSLCSLDNGKMWGVNLYGATMFVFPENRVVIANEPDKNGSLFEKEGLFIGKLPDNINIANTSLEWNGKNWPMVNWNALPKNDKYSSAKLMIHESWHRIQKDIGIRSVITKNSYLDDLQGSILLKLEFIALDSALTCKENNQLIHLTNALKIRTYRQSLFPDNNENAFELHEGMAEYTGLKLCGIANDLLPVVAAKKLESGLDKEALANSFPYITGPAYGVLFDELDGGWLDEVRKGKNLPEIGRQIINEDIPSDTVLLKEYISKIIKQYKAESLIKREKKKFEFQKQLVDTYKHKFFKGDILVINNNNIQMRFNPQEKLVPVENGVVYKTMRLSGEWGFVEIKDGIYRSNDWQFFILPAPAIKTTGIINETGYELKLNKGWKIEEVKEGKYVIKKE